MKNSVISFEEAISLSDCEKNCRSALLGNGFSIAGHPQFNYKRLYNESRLDASIRELFQRLNTYDFEVVISILELTINKYESYYQSEIEKISLAKYYKEKIREEFFESITRNHPFINAVFNASHGLTVRMRTCEKFISHFSKIFTTNYDLLLYWQIMCEKDYSSLRIPMDDGFISDENSNLIWLEPHQHFGRRRQNIFYLHGSLFFNRRNNLLLKERSRGCMKKTLEKNIISEGQLPLAVLEGSYKTKLKKIIKDSYLRNAYKELNQLSGDLFIFGHSLNISCDAHILYAIKVSKVKNIFISIYGDKNNNALKERTELAFKNKNIYFFDADSAQVWTPKYCMEETLANF